VIEDPPEWLDVSIVGRYPPTDRLIQRLRIMRWKFIDKRHIQDRLTYLRFLACGRISCYAWDPVGVYQKMLQADIGIIPINTLPEHKPCVSPPSWKVKSENRLTMKMCVGLPVIATPIPSYEPIIEHGRNGFLARSRQEWIEYLNVLRDPTLRKSIGEQARESVLRRYSMQEQARLLVGILQELIS
jgi:glycosyltransferase involved in cell wall biosynthesis